MSTSSKNAGTKTSCCSGKGIAPSAARLGLRDLHIRHRALAKAALAAGGPPLAAGLERKWLQSVRSDKQVPCVGEL